MKRSTDRVLTTHAGSLPRPDDVLDMLRAGQKGEPFEARVGAGGRRDRAPASRARPGRRRRRRGLQAELRHLRHRATRRPGASPGRADRHLLVRRLAGAPGVPGVLRGGRRALGRRRRAGPADAVGLHRTDPLRRPRGRSARHREPEGRAPGRRGCRGVPAGHLAVERPGVHHQRVLPVRRGVPGRHRRRPPRGVPGHRRCRPAAPDRRSAACHAVHPRPVALRSRSAASGPSATSRS